MGFCLKVLAAVLLIWGANTFVFSFTVDERNFLGRGLNFTFTRKEHPCLNHACYPARGNLLAGRGKNIRASSTCGLTGEGERFCEEDPYSKARNCYICYSKENSKWKIPTSLDHGVENLIPEDSYNPLSWSWRKNPWWQSENGVENVTIQFDLEEEFIYTHLILTFKTARPKAMFIEKSRDFGKSWSAVRYFAENCSEVFPGVSTQFPVRHSDVFCDSRSSSRNPTYLGEVIHRVLPPHLKVDDPYSEEIQNLMAVTNIRLNFVKLHTLNGDDPSGENKENYYYALLHFSMQGACNCNGHAARCIPADGKKTGKKIFMVHPKCECFHNTKGNHCQICDGKYDLPWKPAIEKDVEMCKNHSA